MSVTVARQPDTTLTDFADQYLGTPTSGHPFATVAPDVAQQLYDLLGKDAPIEPLLATLFWQIVQATRSYSKLIRELGALSRPGAPPETIIVPRGPENKTRYDLLILDRAFGSSPEKRVVSLQPTELDEAYQAWGSRRLFELDRDRARDVRALQRDYRLIRAIPSDFASRAADSLSFSLLVAALPPVEYTSVPRTAWGVAVPASAQPTSTAGAVVRDEKGRAGVTAALHAVNGNTNTLCIGTAVAVSGNAGTVHDADLVSDCCFIEVDPLPGTTRTTAGPLIGVSPRQYEAATFEGLTSGSVKAVVQGWTCDIPLVMSNNQLKVFTDNVTNPGDSGAALRDTHGNLLGFSFYRSNTSPPYYSAWIWADSVFTALRLTAF
jgi:hypothetical protein